MVAEAFGGEPGIASEAGFLGGRVGGEGVKGSLERRGGKRGWWGDVHV